MQLSIFCFQICGKDVYSLITEQFATVYQAIMSYGVSCSMIQCPSCVSAQVERFLLFLINVPDSGNQHSLLTEILRLACLYSTEYKIRSCICFPLLSACMNYYLRQFHQSYFNNFPFHIHANDTHTQIHTHIAAQCWRAPHSGLCSSLVVIIKTSLQFELVLNTDKVRLEKSQDHSSTDYSVAYRHTLLPSHLLTQFICFFVNPW